MFCSSKQLRQTAVGLVRYPQRSHQICIANAHVSYLPGSGLDACTLRLGCFSILRVPSCVSHKFHYSEVLRSPPSSSRRAPSTIVGLIHEKTIGGDLKTTPRVAATPETEPAPAHGSCQRGSSKAPNRLQAHQGSKTSFFYLEN